MKTHTQSNDRRDARSTAVARGALLLLVLAIAAAAVDLSLQQAVASYRPPGVVRDYFTATETFGNGFGVIMIVTTVVVLDRTRRVQTSRFLAAALGAGIVADIVKLAIARSRPHATDIDGLLAHGASSWDTFLGALPLTSLGSGGQSFPSAHTATAIGLAVALTHAYPTGRRLFYSFAVGVALQRVCVGAHYLSDVLAGAAVGILWGNACWATTPVARGFDRMEAWWADRFGWSQPALPGEDEPGEPMVLSLPPAAKPAAARRAA